MFTADSAALHAQGGLCVAYWQPGEKQFSILSLAGPHVCVPTIAFPSSSSMHTLSWLGVFLLLPTLVGQKPPTVSAESQCMHTVRAASDLTMVYAKDNDVRETEGYISEPMTFTKG